MSKPCCYGAGMNLNRQQFETAVKRGLNLYEELKSDYTELLLHPVFSRFGPGSGQCNVTTDLRKIVMEFPQILTDSDAHGNAKNFAIFCSILGGQKRRENRMPFPDYES